MRPIRLLLADDHALVLQALRFALEPEPEIEIVGEARSGSEVLFCQVTSYSESAIFCPTATDQSAGTSAGVPPTAIGAAGTIDKEIA